MIPAVLALPNHADAGIVNGETLLGDYTVSIPRGSGGQSPVQLQLYLRTWNVHDVGCCFLCGGCGAPPAKDGQQEVFVRMSGAASGDVTINPGGYLQTTGHRNCKSEDDYGSAPISMDQDGAAHGIFYRSGDKLFLKLNIKTFRCGHIANNNMGCDSINNAQDNVHTIEIRPNGQNFFFATPPPQQCNPSLTCCNDAGNFRGTNENCEGTSNIGSYVENCGTINNCPATRTIQRYYKCPGNSGECPHTGQPTGTIVNTGTCTPIRDYPCQCTPGQTRACPKQQGVCSGAVETCSQDYLWPGCTDATYAAHAASQSNTYQAAGPFSDNICDNKDNDCDGQVDEGTDKGAACTNEQVGACYRAGTKVCTANGGTTCNAPSITPGTEICGNNIDENCNGIADENPPCICQPGQTRSCPLQAGVCAGSIETCGANGNWPGCTAANYGSNYRTTDFLCDGLDNDCDSQIDEETNFDTCVNGCQSAGHQYVGGHCCGDQPTEQPGPGGVWGTEICSTDAQGYAYRYDGTMVVPQYDENCDGLINEGVHCPDVCVPKIGTDSRGLLENRCYPTNPVDYRPDYCARDDNVPQEWRGSVVQGCNAVDSVTGLTCGCPPPDPDLGQYGPLTCMADGTCTYSDTTPPILNSFMVIPNVALRYLDGDQMRTQDIRLRMDITDEGSQVLPGAVLVYYKYYEGTIPPTLPVSDPPSSFNTHVVPLPFIKTGSTYEATWQWTTGTTLFTQDGYYLFKIVAADQSGNPLDGSSGGVIAQSDPQFHILHIISSSSACTRLQIAGNEATNKVFDYFFLADGFTVPGDYAKFEQLTTDATNYISTTIPFSNYAHKINIWRVNAPLLDLACTPYTEGPGFTTLHYGMSSYPALRCQNTAIAQSVMLDCLAAVPESVNTLAGVEQYTSVTGPNVVWKSDKVIRIKNTDLFSNGWFQYQNLAYPTQTMTPIEAVQSFLKLLGTNFGVYPYDYYFNTAVNDVVTLDELNPPQNCASHPSRANCPLCDPSQFLTNPTLAQCALENNYYCLTRNDVPNVGVPGGYLGGCQNPRDDYGRMVSMLNNK